MDQAALRIMEILGDPRITGLYCAASAALVWRAARVASRDPDFRSRIEGGNSFYFYRAALLFCGLVFLLFYAASHVALVAAENSAMRPFLPAYLAGGAAISLAALRAKYAVASLKRPQGKKDALFFAAPSLYYVAATYAVLRIASAKAENLEAMLPMEDFFFAAAALFALFFLLPYAYRAVLGRKRNNNA